MDFNDEDEVGTSSPFAVRLDGTDQFLKVHRGRNGLPNGMLTWEEKHGATWFDTREGAAKFLGKLIGEKASIFDGRIFR
jgi:hypothetical protein